MERGEKKCEVGGRKEEEEEEEEETKMIKRKRNKTYENNFRETICFFFLFSFPFKHHSLGVGEKKLLSATTVCLVTVPFHWRDVESALYFSTRALTYPSLPFPPELGLPDRSRRQ